MLGFSCITFTACSTFTTPSGRRCTLSKSKFGPLIVSIFFGGGGGACATGGGGGGGAPLMGAQVKLAGGPPAGAPAAPPPAQPPARPPAPALLWLLTATPPVTPPTVPPISAPATAHVPQRRWLIVVHPLRARATASPRPSVFQSRMRPPRVGRGWKEMLAGPNGKRKASQ